MNLNTLKQLIRHYGVGWIAYRVWKSTSEKLGYWKFKLPSKPWSHFGDRQFVTKSDWGSVDEFFQWRQGQGAQFFFSPDTIDEKRESLCRMDPNPDWPQQTQERIETGEFPYFGSCWFSLGAKPDWFLNPYTGKRGLDDGHFSQINEFGFGDVKAIWEASRFGFVFPLVRSYARTGDERCPERFWELLEHWMQSNPPYQGMNWKCGQEASLRFLAAVFGLFAMSNSSTLTLDRLGQFVQFAAATGNRVEKHIHYAISQKNNHGISEAVALWSIGVLFPEIKHADRWKKVGQSVLVQLCRELIYEDGAFSQHSANYHRLVLHLLAWTQRLADVNQIQLDPVITNGFQRATDFIRGLSVGSQGQVPRYGNDDGALILPLNHCDYFDFRPVIQLCHTLVHGRTVLEAGPWDEDLFWFGVSPEPSSPFVPPRTSGRQSWPNGGYHRIQHGQTSVFVRAGEFQHRPTQSDMMHVDLWWKGHNIALDPGTYSYNGEQHWKNIPLMDSRHHNTVTVDGREPEQKISKFLLLPWNRAQRVQPRHATKVLAMEWKRTMASGLEDPVTHHRAVFCLPDDAVGVLDAVWSAGSHQYELGWLLCGPGNPPSTSPGRVKICSEAGEYWLQIGSNQSIQTDELSGCPDSARGWFAPRYLDRQPARSCLTRGNGNNLVFISIFAPLETTVRKYAGIPLAQPENPTCLLDSDLMTTIIKTSQA